MKITTNVARFAGQVAMIAEIIERRIGSSIITPALHAGDSIHEVVHKWIEYCNQVEPEERINSKVIHTKEGQVRLTRNDLNGNVKIQIKTKQLKFVIPGLQA